MPTLSTPETGRRLTEFAGAFHDLFPRTDQARWLGVYLQGLLEVEGRKTVEAIARGVTVPAEWAIQAPAQALQHFLSKGPWDERTLLRRFRENHVGQLRDPEACWVIQEMVVPKRGRHSVGVQRQFSRGDGKKVNCQTALVLSQSGPRGWLPLACRLYLPRTWLAEAGPAALAGIPEAFRNPMSKEDVAHSLVDELLAGGVALPVQTDDSYAASADFRDGVQQRGLELRDPLPGADWREQAREGCDWLKTRLGFDDFEGRSWLGWHHHVGLVCLAFGFLRLAREK